MGRERLSHDAVNEIPARSLRLELSRHVGRFLEIRGLVQFLRFEWVALLLVAAVLYLRAEVKSLTIWQCSD
jgi:hypothetical protein